MKKSILPVLFTLFMLFVGAGVALADPGASTPIINVSGLKPDHQPQLIFGGEVFPAFLIL